MPVTIAHPIAAIPLRRPLGRLGVLSALVIGSITPDVPFFLPFSLHRTRDPQLDRLVLVLPAGRRSSRICSSTGCSNGRSGR